MLLSLIKKEIDDSYSRCISELVNELAFIKTFKSSLPITPAASHLSAHAAGVSLA